MRFLVVFMVFLFSLQSCSDNSIDETSSEQSKKNGQGDESYEPMDYFFPNDSLIPYIYVFQEAENPMDEKFYRMYRLQNDQDTSLVVERFNANFRITEGFTHDLTDSLKVKEYMVVDKDGIKRTAELLSSRVFPMSRDEQVYFVADFPAHVDSLTMIYESKRNVAETGLKINVLGKEVDAIKLTDSLNVHLVDPLTQKSNTKKVVTNRYYAKGYGLVEWGSDELNVHYRLKKVLTNKWWEEYAQGPQVKM